MTEPSGRGQTFEPAEAGARSGDQAGPLDLLRGRPLVRRLTMAASYALLTVLLASVVAGRIPTARRALENVGRMLPERVAELGGDPFTLALIAMGTIAFFLAAGTFLVSRDTGSAFALLVVGTVAWFLFPFSEVPWTSLVTGQEARFLPAPASAWLLGGLLVTVATAEVLLSARSTLLADVARRDLPEPMVKVTQDRTLLAVLVVLGAGVLAGGMIALLYAAFRAQLTRGLLSEPNLIWVPAIAGLVAGGLIWLGSRRI